MFIITLPIYLLIGLGFACVRTVYIAGDSVRALSGFLVKVGPPALIFNAVVSPNTENAMNWTFMGGQPNHFS